MPRAPQLVTQAVQPKPATAFIALELASVERGDQGGLTPPKEFLIFPMGKHTSEKGDYVFDKKSAKSVLEAAKRKGNDIPIDYEHNMVRPNEKTPGDGPQPAAGWFSLEVRDDGLWATNVRWTDRAMKYLSGKEYRYYSPAFLHVDGHIEELINVGLTNTPAQHAQTPLVAAKDDGHTTTTQKERPTMNKKLLAMLKLTEGATDDAVEQRLLQLISNHKKLVALTGKKTTAEAEGVIEAWKTTAERVVTLEAEIKEQKRTKRKAEVAALVEQGLKERKITPAQKDHMVAAGMRKDGVAFLKAFLENASPVINPKKPVQEKDGKVQVVLTDDHKRIAAMLGIKAEDLAASAARHEGVVPEGSTEKPAN